MAAEVNGAVGCDRTLASEPVVAGERRAVDSVFPGVQFRDCDAGGGRWGIGLVEALWGQYGTQPPCWSPVCPGWNFRWRHLEALRDLAGGAGGGVGGSD